jgi:hypothetical protein
MISEILSAAIRKINEDLNTETYKGLCKSEIVRVRNEMQALEIRLDHPEFKISLEYKEKIGRKLIDAYTEENATYILNIVFPEDELQKLARQFCHWIGELTASIYTREEYEKGYPPGTWGGLYPGDHDKLVLLWIDRASGDHYYTLEEARKLTKEDFAPKE